MTDASRPAPAQRPAPTADGRITDKGCRDVLLFLAHDTRPGAMAELRRIIAECSAHLDVVPLFDGSHNEIDRSALPEGSLVITYDEVVEGLDYPEKLKYRPGHFVDRDLDLPVIWFFRRYGGYRRYWLTEYDVRFSGHWMVLFDHFRDNTSDLLATTIFEPSVRMNWAHWHTFQGPTDIPLEQRCRATMSFYGLSHRGVAELHRAYREGYAGNYELMIPTLLKVRGLTLEDIGGNGRYVAPENLNRFYLNTPEIGGLAPGTFVLRESGKIDREMPNMLWNPFKD